MDFAATHTISGSGAPSWATPDVATPESARLDPWLPVQVVQVWGDWVRVRCENGWETWTDGRTLVATSAGTPGAPSTPVSPASPIAPAAAAPAPAPAPAWNPAAPAAAPAADPTWTAATNPARVAPPAQGWADAPTAAVPAAAAWTPPAADAGAAWTQQQAGSYQQQAPYVQQGPAPWSGSAGYPSSAGTGAIPWWRIAGAAGGVAAVLGSFLPWLSVGGLSVNGWDLRMSTLISNKESTSGPYAGLVVLLAVVGVAAWFARPQDLPLAGVGLLVGGLAACVPALFTLLRWNQADIKPNLGIGVLLTLFGGAALLAAGGAVLAGSRRAPR